MLSSPSSDTQQEFSPAAEVVPERPSLAPGVKFAGPMQGVGFTERLWLIQRGSRLLQTPEPFFRVAEQINGERTFEEIAAAVMESTDWLMSAELVQKIIEEKLVPIGLVCAVDGSVLSHIEDRNRAPLQINLHRHEVGPGAIRPITRLLRYLFTPRTAIPLLIAAGVSCAWLYLARGVASGIRKVLHSARRFAGRVAEPK